MTRKVTSQLLNKQRPRQPLHSRCHADRPHSGLMDATFLEQTWLKKQTKPTTPRDQELAEKKGNKDLLVYFCHGQRLTTHSIVIIAR